jgi:hypothetical protein
MTIGHLPRETLINRFSLEARGGGRRKRCIDGFENRNPPQRTASLYLWPRAEFMVPERKTLKREMEMLTKLVKTMMPSMSKVDVQYASVADVANLDDVDHVEKDEI